ncbi:hypothetical protein AK812_SmicGene45170, partial [Symbiodinium microadriaticum]
MAVLNVKVFYPDGEFKMEISGSCHPDDFVMKMFETVADFDFEGYNLVACGENGEDWAETRWYSKFNLEEYFGQQIVPRPAITLVINDAYFEHRLKVTGKDEYEDSSYSSKAETDDNDSNGTTTESEDDDDDDGEGDKKSRDGDDKGGYHDKDHDGDASSGSSAMTATAMVQEFLTTTPETLDKHLHYIIELTNSKDETQALMNNFKAKAVSIYNAYNKSRDKVKKFEKEERAVAKAKATAKSRAEKAQETEEKKQTTVTLNIRPSSEMAPFTIKMTYYDTVLDIKEAIGQKIGLSKSKAKHIVLNYNNRDFYKQDNRKTVGKYFPDGSTVTMASLGSDGAKRKVTDTPLSLKSDKMEEVMTELQLNLLQLESKGVPNIAGIYKHIVSIAKKPENTNLDNTMETLSIETLKLLQSALRSSNNDTVKFDALTKHLGGNIVATIADIEKYSKVLKGATKCLTIIMTYRAYLTDSGKMSWEP